MDFSRLDQLAEDIREKQADPWTPEHPSEPLTPAQLRGLRQALPEYARSALIPRLVATIDALSQAQEQA